MRHTTAMNQFFAEGRAEAASKLLRSLVLVRAPRLPLLWTGEVQPSAWSKSAGATVWTRVYKGARAQRSRRKAVP